LVGASQPADRATRAAATTPAMGARQEPGRKGKHVISN